MQLKPCAARIGQRLSIEQRAPIPRRQQDDVVGRRLRLSAARQPDCLEHRVLVRQLDDAGDDDIDRVHAKPIDRDLAAHGGVKIGRRLLGQQWTGQRAEQ
jgi:hypothetical protein